MEIELLGGLGHNCPIFPKSDNDVLQLILTFNQLMQAFFDWGEIQICLLDSPQIELRKAIDTLMAFSNPSSKDRLFCSDDRRHFPVF